MADAVVAVVATMHERLADLHAPGQVLLRLAVAGSDVVLPRPA